MGTSKDGKDLKKTKMSNTSFSRSVYYVKYYGSPNELTNTFKINSSGVFLSYFITLVLSIKSEGEAGAIQLEPFALPGVDREVA